jgi:hypothetical protein
MRDAMLSALHQGDPKKSGKGKITLAPEQLTTATGSFPASWARISESTC